MIKEQYLRISSVKFFPDENELLGFFLYTLDNPYFQPYGQDGINKAIENHKIERESCFVSSWTRSRDIIAMWEIYSPTRTSVQIGVRRVDILAAFNKHMNLNSFDDSHNTPANDGRILFYPVSDGACEYVDYNNLFGKIRNCHKKFRAMSKTQKIKERDRKEFFHLYEKFANETLIEIRKAILYKNKAYSFEREHRFSLRAVTRNERRYEDCEGDFSFDLMDTHLRPTRISDTGNNIYIPFDTSNIAEVWLDGRLPDWKADAQKRLLSDLGLSASISNAYGSFFDQNKVTPLR